MPTRRLLIRWLLLGMLLLSAAPPAWSQPDEGQGLVLTSQQQSQLRAIRERYRGRFQDLQLRLEGRRLELAQLLQRDDVDKDAVSDKLDEIIELERQRQRLSVEQIFECKSHLRPGQWGPYRRRVLSSLLQARRRGSWHRRDSNEESP